MDTIKFKSVSEYFKAQTPASRKKLKQIRDLVSEIPGAEESISYNMPAVKLNGKSLFYYAAAKNHIGFYAMPTAHEAFKKELSKFKTGKGSVQFPMDEELPEALIKKMIRFRMNAVKSGK